MRRYLVLLCAILLIVINSQISYGQVTTSYSVTGTGVTLHASITGSSAFASPLSLTTDDAYSSVLPIGFLFNFYGNDYSQCVVGANGNICFNTVSAGVYNPWPIDAALLGNTSMLNSICGIWSDKLMSGGGVIRLYVDGVAPNRRLVLFYCGPGQYSCVTQKEISTIVLHESTNIIDIFVGRHISCPTWNYGRAIEGIQNATGTAATVVPGRDFPAAWSTVRDAHRFTPVSGGSSYSVSAIAYSSVPYPIADISVYWYNGSTGAYVGSGTSLYIPSTAPESYVARAVACLDTFCSDTVVIPPLCIGTPSAGVVSANSATACSTTSILLNVSGASSGPDISFQWQSSADSVMWSDVVSATSNTYTFTGLSATAFYRCRVSCSTSGFSAFTPGFRLTYSTVCPCLHTAGFIVPGPATACSTSVITLSSTGYTTGAGVALQWQSSVDSVSWSDIAGATAVPYTFSGITATTFYRLKATCIATSLSVFSNVRKVTLTPSCSCATISTLLGGAATASTSICSSCVLSLGLSGASSAYDISYQWQFATTTSSGWSSIPGATNSSYSCSPTIPQHYRCLLSCSGSGASAYSTSVFVNVAASILEDSIKHIEDTVCNGQLFFIKASNNSPLLRVKTYFGDGLTSLSTLTPAGTTSYVNVGHSYTTPGIYSVRQVLYSDSLPMDSISFTYLHRECNLFLLKFYNDANGNCSKDASEIYSHNPFSVRVDSNGIPVDTLTATGGVYYKAPGSSGTIYSFTSSSAFASVVCPSSATIYDTIGAVSGLTRTRYFGFNCTSTYFDVVEYVTMQCGRSIATAKVLVANNICSEIAVNVNTSISPKYVYVLPNALIPATHVAAGPFVTTQDLSWSTFPLSAVSPNPLFTVNFKVPGGLLTVGDTVHSKYVALPVIDDQNPANNVIIRQDTVKASYDPNMIEVFPPGCFDADTVLQYIVHFENMGNDTAHNVHVLDTLSSNLDASTFEMLATSANMNVYKYQDAGHTIIKFDFPNIKLLDSSWQGLNDGMFVFKIRTKPGIAFTSTIPNRVGIYFDENEVVMTNTVQNLKGCPVTAVAGTASRPQVLLYPNPVTDELTIKTTSGEFASFAISNIVGVQLATGVVDNEVTRTHTAHLPPGVYYVTLRGAAGTEVRKFVKR